ncbi:Uncharacterised protein [Streptococcus pneumoniae]|nr:Uncharacterised protein [Streptococcus pneumoniae]CIW24983.1 Uncharacterised protein [Streptococcus pneumoniae]
MSQNPHNIAEAGHCRRFLKVHQVTFPFVEVCSVQQSFAAEGGDFQFSLSVAIALYLQEHYLTSKTHSAK